MFQNQYFTKINNNNKKDVFIPTLYYNINIVVTPNVCVNTNHFTWPNGRVKHIYNGRFIFPYFFFFFFGRGQQWRAMIIIWYYYALDDHNEIVNRSGYDDFAQGTKILLANVEEEGAGN